MKNTRYCKIDNEYILYIGNHYRYARVMQDNLKLSNYFDVY
jgi:hypothetical protein